MTNVKQQQTITIEPMRMRELTVTIRGLSPLICHRKSPSVIKSIEDKQQNKGTKIRKARNPKQEFEDSLYPTGNKNEYGIPAIAFWKSMIESAKGKGWFDNLDGKKVKGMTRVLGDVIAIKGKITMRTDTVTIGRGIMDIRYRGQFDTNWSCQLKIRYNESQISHQQIITLLNVSGFSVGIGDWRPQKDGNFGTFEVATDKPIIDKPVGVKE